MVMAPIDCRPCGHFECPIEHPCSQAVTAEAVLAAAISQLEAYPDYASRPNYEASAASETAVVAATEQLNVTSITRGGPLCVDYAS
jgi:hypothetical protein